jgi:hypothetical protein
MGEWTVGSREKEVGEQGGRGQEEEEIGRGEQNSWGEAVCGGSCWGTLDLGVYEVAPFHPVIHESAN